MPIKRIGGIRPICLKTNLEAFTEMPAKNLDGISFACQKKDSVASPEKCWQKHSTAHF
jgi:hypothetical protein